jgi:hypothetical protein
MANCATFSEVFGSEKINFLSELLGVYLLYEKIMDIFITKILPALLGFLAGIAGSLIAPWVNWGIEKKREKKISRKELIKRTREFLGSPEWDQSQFSGTITYSEIRPHLSEKIIELIEGGTINIQVDRGGNVIKSAVLDDIAKKEKEWEII